MIFASGPLVFLLFLASEIHGISGALQKTGLQELCERGSGNVIHAKDTWTADSSAILVPRLSRPYRPDTDCTVVVKTPTSNHGIVVSVREIDLRPFGKDTLLIGFSEDRFMAREFVNSYSIRNRQFDQSEFKSYYFQGNVTIKFVTGSSSSTYYPIYNGFQLVYTVTSKTPCGSYEFRCSTYKCIAQDLQCDGHNHCGDSSDQFDCDEVIMRPIGSIVGGVFGGIFLIIAMACALVFISKRNRRTVRRTTTHPPPPYSHQQLYPPVGAQYPPPPTYEQTFSIQGDGIVNPSYR